MSHLKLKQQDSRVTYVFFESVTLNKYSKISVPTPTISVFQSLPRSPTLSPTHTILTSPITATALPRLPLNINFPNLYPKPPPPHNINIPNLYPRPPYPLGPIILTSPMSVPKHPTPIIWTYPFLSQTPPPILTSSPQPFPFPGPTILTYPISVPNPPHGPPNINIPKLCTRPLPPTILTYPMFVPKLPHPPHNMNIPHIAISVSEPAPPPPRY